MNRLFEMMSYLNEDFENSEEKPSFIIPVGISGSGKSTWIKSYDTENTEVVSPDDIRRELTGDVSDQTQNKKVFQVATKRAAEYLESGKDVIFDATNVSSFGRKKLLGDLKNMVNREFGAYAKIFDADPEVSKERISKDIEMGVDRSNVPPEIIDRQYATFKKDLDKIGSDGYEIIS